MGEEQNRIGKTIKKLVGEQTKSIDNIKSIMDKLDASQLTVEKNAFDAINSSDTALNLVKDGMYSMETLSKHIEELNKAVNVATETVKEMENMTHSIANFANVIAGISSKTNILSLNASIEAARAGEHGKGFAVVAEEVRNLAAQSAKSSKEMADTIYGVQSFGNKMDGDIKEIVNIIKEENNMVKTVEGVFKKILDASYISNDVSRNMEHEIAYQRDITDGAKNAIQAISNASEKSLQYIETL